MKIVSLRREQANRCRMAVVFEAKREIPVNS